MTPSYVVDKCNELRRHERALQSLHKRHMASRFTETWSDEFSALLSGWAAVSVELRDYRERVSQQCAPWFEVQQ